MNFGFSTGDDNIPAPYFYATAYPTPAQFKDAPLPPDAYWQTDGFTGVVLPYEDIVAAGDPKAKLLDFLQTVHKAGSALMD